MADLVIMAQDLTVGSTYRNIIDASLPMVIALGLHSAFNIVDAYFVGQISARALAAVTVSFPVMFLIIAVSTGIGTGVMISSIQRSTGT